MPPRSPLRLTKRRVSHCQRSNRRRQLTCVVREVLLQRGSAQLSFEEIDFVEEKNDRSLGEPARVADGIKERQGFLHPVLFD